MTPLSKNQTAYDCLRIYVKELGKDKSGAQTSAQQEGLYLAFRAGAKGFLVRSDEVLEITRSIQTITPLPFSYPWMEGLVNARGDVLFVVNFSLFVDPEYKRKVREPAYLVLGDEAQSFMIKVDEVQGMRHYPEMIAVDDDYIDGVKVTPSEEWLRINLDKLLSGGFLLNSTEY